MRVQVQNQILTGGDVGEVSRDLTLFNARDELLTGFQCRATSIIADLSMTLNDTVDFEIVVQGN